MDRQCPLFAAQALDLKERHNKALHLTPVNVAKMHDDHRLFRVERALLGRGAQVSSSVGRRCPQGNRVTFFVDFYGVLPTFGHIPAQKLSLFPTWVS